PPSRHKDGGLYAWTPGHGPEDIEVAPMPAWLVEQLRVQPHQTRSGNGEAPAADGEEVPEGGRGGKLASLAGTMRHRGMTEAEILAALQVINAERCKPPLPDDQVAKIARSVARYEPATGPRIVFGKTATDRHEGNGDTEGLEVKTLRG